jgi:hypothetical protein
MAKPAPLMKVRLVTGFLFIIRILLKTHEQFTRVYERDRVKDASAWLVLASLLEEVLGFEDFRAQRKDNPPLRLTSFVGAAHREQTVWVLAFRPGWWQG